MIFCFSIQPEVLVSCFLASGHRRVSSAFVILVVFWALASLPFVHCMDGDTNFCGWIYSPQVSLHALAISLSSLSFSQSCSIWDIYYIYCLCLENLSIVCWLLLQLTLWDCLKNSFFVAFWIWHSQSTLLCSTDLFNWYYACQCAVSGTQPFLRYHDLLDNVWVPCVARDQTQDLTHAKHIWPWLSL